MKTIMGREINVRENRGKRTFTIRTISGKYRTTPMSKLEFNSAENWTANDWQHFLDHSQSYYLVK